MVSLAASAAIVGPLAGLAAVVAVVILARQRKSIIDKHLRDDADDETGTHSRP